MKVSVVIPTYNDEGTIAATVESALAQRFEGEFEVIVVNDGSTDGTRAELAKFGDRIRVIDQENGGVSVARNAGIRAAAGEYIALLDGDDTWMEDKLAKTVPVLDKNPACVAVFTNVIGVDGAGREVWRYVSPEFQHSPTLDEMLEWPWPILPSAFVIRRDTLQAIGGFSEEFKPEHWGGEDTFLTLLVREHGEIVYVPETLVRYRLPGLPRTLRQSAPQPAFRGRFSRGIPRVRAPIRRQNYPCAIDARALRRARPQNRHMGDRYGRTRSDRSWADGDAPTTIARSHGGATSHRFAIVR